MSVPHSDTNQQLPLPALRPLQRELSVDRPARTPEGRKLLNLFSQHWTSRRLIKFSFLFGICGCDRPKQLGVYLLLLLFTLSYYQTGKCREMERNPSEYFSLQSWGSLSFPVFSVQKDVLLSEDWEIQTSLPPVKLMLLQQSRGAEEERGVLLSQTGQLFPLLLDCRVQWLRISQSSNLGHNSAFPLFLFNNSTSSEI